ncbi:MAG TPA: protein kinase [Candidatus Acidoferrales bacterium]|nr:protein kinase [Candidatus Acidoferrales bacterium]
MSDETVGKRIGDYEILGELGKGGMGKVYKVRNVISDRVEAMKVLLPDLAGQKDLADRFLREIKVLASLNHPNIAALRTAFTAENQLVMIMEYVDGETLAALIEDGPIPVADALKYMDDALAALSYAHHQNIIHRDVKPSNMMITPQGLLKLMDFGIARSGNDQSLTVTGTALGSLNYMPPEQIQGGAVDARSDIYSLGISLYEIVTGKQPFKRDSDFAIMAAHMKETAKRPIELRPDLPQGLNDMILMAMSKDPAMRFQTADAFRAALGSVRQSLGTGQQAATPLMTQITPPAWTPTPAVAQPGTSAAPPRIPTQPVPQPTANQMPPTAVVAAQATSHRGLYITLGAVIVLVVLVAAGFAVPRYLKARASGQQSALPQTSDQSPAAPVQAQPVSAPANAAPGSTSGNVATPPAVDPAAAAKAAAAAKRKQEQEAAAAAAAQAAADAQAQAEAQARAVAEARAQALAQAEHQMDQLNGRVASVKASLGTLKNSMSAQGLGLRGDMVAAEARMDNDVTKAQQALDAQNPDRAQTYMKQAEAEVEKLEKFLGH